MADFDKFQSTFGTRYCSPEMIALFSARRRISTWRQLWTWLAEAEQELGMDITDAQIQQLKNAVHIKDVEFPIAAEEEMKVRHDVMAHVHTYGLAAPQAAGIIHLGATSCFVTDNADLIILRDGLRILKGKLVTAIRKLSDFALQHKDLPCLGATHLQPAQLVTVGKRAAGWVHSLLRDLRNLDRALQDLLVEFRGCKGTTGTQASYLALFEGSHSKVLALDRLVTKKAGFTTPSFIATQTYDRKIDVDVLNPLGSFGATVQKIGGDIRHLAAVSEIEEPFETNQTGSSAMPYKRNPMLSERLCSLGRLLANQPKNAIDTFAAQLLERTLDDSAIRRTSLPEAFLCADACLRILNKVCNGLVVYPAVMKMRIQDHLPFMAAENIIVALVRKGGNRQRAHEEIKRLSHEASAVVKLEGKKNDLLERISRTEFFAPVREDLPKLLDQKTFIGRAPEQVVEFIEQEVNPALTLHEQGLGIAEEPLHV